MNNSTLCMTFLISVIVMGCSHTKELTDGTSPDTGTVVNYSITYYIHADSDYLYHTPDGKPVRGNSEVLNTARSVGKAARSGDVMIFYQRPERKVLGLFPRRSSRFYHYKNGELINRVNYRHPDKKEDFLATEARFINQYRTYDRSSVHQNYFLYYGHEIPVEYGKGYHQTISDMDVTDVSFSKGIRKFLPADGRFNLVVLSTCNNGTPAMAEHLIPFTDLMLASPQNLHLSHIDSDALSILESDPDSSSIQLARSMAEQTYHRLAEDIQTTITLALYDLEVVRSYITPLITLTQTHSNLDPSVQFQDNTDCAVLTFPDSVSYRDGVETWYQPARFGRKSGRSTHSGWGCKPGLQSEK